MTWVRSSATRYAIDRYVQDQRHPSEVPGGGHSQGRAESAGIHDGTALVLYLLTNEGCGRNLATDGEST